MRFQSILADEFARRRGANPRYSLRAFAGSLGMEHSTLSQLLRGRRPMTWKSIRGIALKMRWTGASVLSSASGGAKFDSRLIASNLNLTVDEVNVALTDLCMLGLIELKGESNECQTP
jgi:transcriptional regulator with XRE-family HTH domain